MKIALDMSIVQINQAGTGLYAANLLKALQRVDSTNSYCVLAVNQQRNMSGRKSLATRLDTLYRDLLWTHGVLPWRAARTGADLLHVPANVIPVLPPCKTVVTILDAIIFRSPAIFPRWQRTYAHLFVPLSARRAQTILTISEQSKRDIVQYTKVPADKVVVTYLAAGPEFQPVAAAERARVRQTYQLNEFVLTVGALEPRKNLLRLLQAFAQLRAGGYPGLLVHAGPKGWQYEDIMAEIARLDLQDAVRFLGRVPLEDLVGLYNSAQMFVYPSLYEGFGLPVLEAMACGCPVITSNVSSLPEVAGDAAILLDPYNVEELAAAMQQLWTDQGAAERLAQRGLGQAHKFSWERCAQETLAVYRAVLAA